MGVEVKLDSSQLDTHIKTLAKVFPRETQKAMARLLKDQAYSYKHRAIEKLKSYLWIRDSKFFEGAAWNKIIAPKDITPIDEMSVTVSTMRKGDQGNKDGYFTGWEELITGGNYAMRNRGSNSYRPIWGPARKGGTQEGKIDPRFSYRALGNDLVPDATQYGMPMIRFLAMIGKSSAAGQSKRAKHFKEKDYAIGKNRVFKISGPGKHDGKWRPGLYHIEEGGDLFGRRQVKMVQAFEETPRKAEKFDWRAAALEDMQKKYTTDYIYATYIAPWVFNMK